MEVTYWGWKVNTFCFSYDVEDDVIVITPMDHNGNQFEDAGLAVDADSYGHFLKKLQQEYKAIMDIRRSAMKAKKRGLSTDMVTERYAAQVVAEDIDEALRIQSKEGDHDEWDVPKP